VVWSVCACDASSQLAAMGSNPQILYTPQQQMGYGGYSVPCRVGNWAEDEYLGVLQTQSHVSKGSTGLLTSQHLGATIGSALEPAMLAAAPEDGAVRFGDAVMLSAALGGVLGLDAITRVPLPQEAYGVARTSEQGAVACLRTAWTITCPPRMETPEDGLLRIGMNFCLAATDVSGQTLYLQSQRYTLHNQNYAASPGPRKQGACAVTTPSADTLWTVVVLDPSQLSQMESHGMPVPANTFVALKHVNSQESLHTSDHAVINKFHAEREVGTFTDVPMTKGQWGKRDGQMVGKGNHWAFTTAEKSA